MGAFPTACFAPIVVALLLGDGAQLRAESVAATDPRCLFEGRTAVMSDGTGDGFVRIGYPGVTLHLAATGGEMRLRCRATTADVYLGIQVDDGPFRRVRLDQGVQNVSLVANGAGPHAVTVVKRTESWQGLLDILGVEVEGGRLVEPTPLPDQRLLFIGDSITCGAAADIRPGDPDEGPHNSSGRHAFGWRLSRLIGAQCHLVSYGGRGVLRDWEGRRAPEQNNAPQFYPLALPDDATAAWDPGRYAPDAVLICLGTNDFNLGKPPEEEFVAAYVDLVRHVRRDAPDARVLLLESPMFGPGQRRDELAALLDEVVRRADSDLVERVGVAHYPGRPTDSHPVAAEHLEMAKALEPLLRERLGW